MTTQHSSALTEAERAWRLRFVNYLETVEAWHANNDGEFIRAWFNCKQLMGAANTMLTIIDRLNAAAQDAREGAWQPIATAPRVGSSMLMCIGNWITVGHWHRSIEKWCCTSPSYELYPRDEQPTHWQPLPAPPTPNEGE